MKTVVCIEVGYDMLSIDKLILWIPLLPLLAAIVTAVLGPKVLRAGSHIPAVICIASSFVFSLLLLSEVRREQHAAPDGGFEIIVPLWNWIDLPQSYELPGAPKAESARDFHVDVVLRIDALTAVMLCMVTFVATLVTIFAAGYMHGDRSYWRFFSYVSLFVFSMTMLVSVSNFVLLFVFWEAVGVCSYLLIGFWYHKPEAAAAGKKAFLVNRVGDFGFALALFLIWTTYGTLDFHDTPKPTVAGSDSLVAKAPLANRDVEVRGVLGASRIAQNDYQRGGVALAICLLLMIGACGKSAQFPLHVWLPDAMEGPTPVSALIHAATMVTAGVYMVTRCTPLFMASPDAQLAVACIGGFTALLAGLTALTQWDLKRVLAYSTVSQLGFMFLGLGTGTLAGITAGMFHLFTHAFFKALLFLGAGSVMHAMGNVIDMRRFGGLRQIMQVTYGTFLIGALALSGLPPFAGFWSKDAILGAMHDKVHLYQHELAGRAQHAADVHSAGSPLSLLTEGQLLCGITGYQWLYYTALFTAFLTAFYTFRALLRTFHGELKVPHEASGHAHESPPTMYWPLILLAAAAAMAGLFFDRTYNTSLAAENRHVFAGFLSHAPQLAAGWVQETPALDTFHPAVAGASILIAIAGVGLAMYLYLGGNREINILTSLMNLEGFSRLLDIQRLKALGDWKWIAWVHRGATRIGLGAVTALFGYLIIGLALLASAPLLVGYYLSPYRLSQHKFFFDELYQVTIVAPLRGLGQFSYWMDRWIVDGAVNAVGYFPRTIGAALRRFQTGLIPFYALAMVVAILLLIASQM